MNRPASKAVVVERLPWVRIPPSPPALLGPKARKGFAVRGASVLRFAQSRIHAGLEPGEIRLWPQGGFPDRGDPALSLRSPSNSRGRDPVQPDRKPERALRRRRPQSSASLSLESTLAWSPAKSGCGPQGGFPDRGDPALSLRSSSNSRGRDPVQPDRKPERALRRGSFGASLRSASNPRELGARRNQAVAPKTAFRTG